MKVESVQPTHKFDAPPNVNFASKPPYPKLYPRKTSSFSGSLSSNGSGTVLGSQASNESLRPPPLPRRQPGNLTVALQSETELECISWNLTKDTQFLGLKLWEELGRIRPAPQSFNGTFVYVSLSFMKLMIYSVASNIITAIESCQRKIPVFPPFEHGLILRVWGLLSPTDRFENLMHPMKPCANASLGINLMAQLSHICEEVVQGSPLPTYVPINVRVLYDVRAQSALNFYQRNRRHDISKLFSKLRERQAVNIAIFLELIMTCDRDGLKTVPDIVQSILEKLGTFDGFRLLELEDLSNLLATYVLTILKLYVKNPGADYLSNVTEVFVSILRLTHRTTQSIFEMVISKLGGYAVPMCLALFLMSIAEVDSEKAVWTARELYQSFENHYTDVIHDASTISQRSISIGMIVKFLCLHDAELCLFLEPMHVLANKVPFGVDWEDIWNILYDQKFYVDQCRRLRKVQQNRKAMLTLLRNNALS